MDSTPLATVQEGDDEEEALLKQALALSMADAQVNEPQGMDTGEDQVSTSIIMILNVHMLCIFHPWGQVVHVSSDVLDGLTIVPFSCGSGDANGAPDEHAGRVHPGYHYARGSTRHHHFSRGHGHNGPQ